MIGPCSDFKGEQAVLMKMFVRVLYQELTDTLRPVRIKYSPMWSICSCYPNVSQYISRFYILSAVVLSGKWRVAWGCTDQWRCNNNWSFHFKRLHIYYISLLKDSFPSAVYQRTQQKVAELECPKVVNTVIFKCKLRRKKMCANKQSPSAVCSGDLCTIIPSDQWSWVHVVTLWSFLFTDWIIRAN